MMEQKINIMEAPSSGKKRIGFLCLPGLETFIKPIAKHFSENYEVRTCYSNNIAELESVINWSDLVIFEFCNEMVVECSQKLPQLKDKKVIVRLHSYEALSNYVSAIRWDYIDMLLFVAEHIKSIVLKRYSKLQDIVEMRVVPNGI